MPRDRTRFINPVAIVRWAAWILPPHRKDWAEAMLNEVAYIESQRVAIHWVVECTLLVISERASYELERTLMNQKVFKVVMGLGAAAVIAVVGIYAIQKPYQQDRIKIALHRAFNGEQPQVGK